MLRNRLLINSSSRINDNSVDPSHDFRVFLDDSIDSGKENIRIGLKKVSIPNTAYTFSEYNNWLYYSLNLDGAEEVKKVELPTDKVFEDVEEVAQELQQALQDKGDNITVDLIEDEYKLQLTNNTEEDEFRIINPVYEPFVLSEGEFHVDIKFTATHKLGFTEDTRGEWIEANGGTYKAPGIAKIINTSIYYITSRTLGDSLRTITPQHEKMEFQMIGSVLNRVGFGNIHQKVFDEESIIFFDMGSGLNGFDVQILDEHYNPINLNRANVVLEFIYFKQ